MGPVNTDVAVTGNTFPDWMQSYLAMASGATKPTFSAQNLTINYNGNYNGQPYPWLHNGNQVGATFDPLAQWQSITNDPNLAGAIAWNDDAVNAVQNAYGTTSANAASITQLASEWKSGAVYFDAIDQQADALVKNGTLSREQANAFANYTKFQQVAKLVEKDPQTFKKFVDPDHTGIDDAKYREGIKQAFRAIQFAQQNGMNDPTTPDGKNPAETLAKTFGYNPDQLKAGMTRLASAMKPADAQKLVERYNSTDGDTLGDHFYNDAVKPMTEDSQGGGGTEGASGQDIVDRYIANAEARRSRGSNNKTGNTDGHGKSIGGNGSTDGNGTSGATGGSDGAGASGATGSGGGGGGGGGIGLLELAMALGEVLDQASQAAKDAASSLTSKSPPSEVLKASALQQVLQFIATAAQSAQAAAGNAFNSLARAQ